uniref:Uncharacterized protein n=1 Tax=Arundo donax TaxID=35708 RepID=A0A0A9GT72_ARUDO
MEGFVKNKGWKGS